MLRPDMSGDLMPRTSSGLSAVITRSGRARGVARVTPYNLSALHNERDTLHLGDVTERISCDGDQIGDLVLLDDAQLVLPVNDGGVDRRCHLERIRGRGAPLDKDWKHLGLHAVRALAGLVEDPSL